MSTSVFLVPNKIISGKGAVEHVGLEAKKLASDSVLIITDNAIAKLSMFNHIIELLERENFKVDIYDRVQPDPPVQTVQSIVNILKEKGCRLVIGVGGGSSMDAAKAAAAIAPFEGEVHDYLGIDLIHGPGLPKILVPSTSGTGSEVTQTAIFTDEKTGVKKKIASPMLLADAAIVDPVMCLSMPYTVTVDTGIDAFVHGLEAYVSRNSSSLTDILSLQAVKIIAESLPKVVFYPDSLKYRENMATAAVFGGMACTNAGLGAVHALTYPLTKYGLTHGRSNAVMLPHVVKYNLPANYERYAQVIRAINENSCKSKSPRYEAKEIYDLCKDLLEEVGVSYRLRDYGIPEDKLEEMAEVAFTSGQHLLKTNPRNLNVDEVKMIYREAW